MITNMYELLAYIDRTGANPNWTGPNTRGEMSKMLKDTFGERVYDLWQEANRSGFVRKGRLWGFCLTRKGYDEFFRLRDVHG